MGAKWEIPHEMEHSNKLLKVSGSAEKDNVAQIQKSQQDQSVLTVLTMCYFLLTLTYLSPQQRQCNPLWADIFV